MSVEEGISVKDTHNTNSSDSTDDYNTGHFGPLAHVNTASSRYPAFGGDLQPGLYRVPKDRKLANPAPLGLCGFALTTFILGCINMQVRGVTEPNIVVGPALAYGGLVQLCAGMWEMAVGNTFGATVLSSYGGFWMSLAITFIPGGFNIMGALEKADNGEPTMFYNSFALYLFGWFIFTTILLLCTLKSTVAFFLLFFTLDMAFLFLALGYQNFTAAGPNVSLIKTGGAFGLAAAFLAWYNALAGIADTSNSFFILPVIHFPWSAQGRENRVKNPAMPEE
ncbi:Meiotically up-regulated protein 86 protein [Elasticomyces elasticus]|nr:Meiotically up-regulated protein 86 protein [Elasticomyces elasticus]